MLTSRSWMGLVGLAAIAAGCDHSPPSTRLAVTAFRVQAATLDWNGQARPDTPRRRDGSATTGGRTSGGWGQHYPWRGPGERPSWYGVNPHAQGSYVLVGSHYYPYYFEEGQVYPVYSMPFTLEGHRFVPAHGPLPAFGPYVLETATARRFQHAQGGLVRS